MPQSANNSNPPANIPQMTPLSVAFPMTFESANPESTNDPRRASTNKNDPNRPAHRHDAGK